LTAKIESFDGQNASKGSGQEDFSPMRSSCRPLAEKHGKKLAEDLESDLALSLGQAIEQASAKWIRQAFELALEGGFDSGRQAIRNQAVRHAASLCKGMFSMSL
jgi:hypothetical protein